MSKNKTVNVEDIPNFSKTVTHSHNKMDKMIFPPAQKQAAAAPGGDKQPPHNRTSSYLPNLYNNTTQNNYNN